MRYGSQGKLRNVALDLRFYTRGELARDYVARMFKIEVGVDDDTQRLKMRNLAMNVSDELRYVECTDHFAC